MEFNGRGGQKNRKREIYLVLNLRRSISALLTCLDHQPQAVSEDFKLKEKQKLLRLWQKENA